MTKEEKRAFEAYPVIPSPYYGGDDDRNIQYRFGFIKGYEQAEKDIIGKACEWLSHRIFNCGEGNLINDFRKAMEEEQ